MEKNKKHTGIIALLFVGVLMGALDISIVGPALPSIEIDLSITDRLSSWIFSIYVLANLVGISLFARLSDVFGRRPLYIIALAIFGIGSIVVSYADSYNIVIVGRAIQGFGASGIFPVASALVGDLYPPERRGRILGLIGAVFGLAFLIGPFLAGMILKYYDWQVLFLINIPICILLIIFSFKIIPRGALKPGTRIDWWGILTLGLSLVGFAYGITSFDIYDISFYHNILPLIVSIVSFLFFYQIEKKNTFPIIRFSFFKNNQIIITAVLAFVTGSIQAGFVFIPKFNVVSFNVEPSTASFMLTPFVIATAIGAPLFGRLIDSIGVKKIVLIGLILSSVGFYLLATINQSYIQYYVSASIIGLGLSVLSGSSLRYLMLKHSSAEDRAISQGIIAILISTGQIVGAALIGVSLATINISHVYQYLFTGVAILLFVMIFVALGLHKDIIKKE